MLVDSSTGEVYTKMIGSAFFVGQVNPQYSFAKGNRAAMAVQRVLRNQVIRPLVGRDRTKSPGSRQVLGRLCCIGLTETTIRSTLTRQLAPRWDSKVFDKRGNAEARGNFARTLHLQHCCGPTSTGIWEFGPC